MINLSQIGAILKFADNLGLSEKERKTSQVFISPVGATIKVWQNRRATNYEVDLNGNLLNID